MPVNTPNTPAPEKTFLSYNPESRRYAVGGRDLHCGDCIALFCGGHWVETRIEHNGALGWYFVGVSPRQACDHEGAEARRP